MTSTVAPSSLPGDLKLTDMLDKVEGEARTLSLSPDCTIRDAVNTLGNNPSLHCLPVLENDRCIGLINMLDIASWIVDCIPSVEYLEPGQMRTLRIAGRELANEEIRNIVNWSRKDPLVPVSETDNVSDIARMFAGGVHAVPFFDSSKHLRGTISQTSLLRSLMENAERIGLNRWLDQSLKDLGLGKSTVLTCNIEKKTIEAISLISKHKVNALALVDGSGILKGNFSATDLKGLILERWDDLLLPLRDYLSKYCESSLAPIVARSDTKLGDVAREMLESQVNRLWVVDRDFKPVGVITMTDLIKMLMGGSGGAGGGIEGGART